MSSPSLRLPILLVIAVPLAAQATRDDLTPLDVSYTVGVSTDLATLKIGIDLDNVRLPSTRLAMPNWMPGTYFIGRFGEHVQDLKATAKDRELQVVRDDFQTWSVATDGVSSMHVEYTMPRATRFQGRQAPDDGPVTGFQIAGPATFLYVVGHKERPVRVRYVLPDGWQYRNGLLRTADPNVRTARDYDTFADAPTLVGTFREQPFAVGGTAFNCVFFDNKQAYDIDIPAFADLCRRIVTYEGQLFGSFPFADYTFLFTLPGGFGGLEHLNSTSIGLDPAGMKKDMTNAAFVTAHEFFHAWNVKRIRPKTLGPFEYEHEDYTENLYVSEGWTSYYGDLTLVRTGIIDPPALLKRLEGYIKGEMNKEGRKLHSVAWASRNVWHRDPDEPPRVDYYDKGELLGALIDLQIRHHTGNGKSLDDVMRFLNRWFAERGVGFEEKDIERACTAISNHDFSEFFSRHVYGTMDPPWAECLAYAGLDYTEESDVAAAFPFAMQRSRQGQRVGAIDASVERTGLPATGATITAIAGKADAPADAFLREHKAGETVQVSWTKDGAKGDSEVTLVEKRTMVPHIRMTASPTPEQLRIRESWLSGK
jgi:predicted metalloprotease with PDZ domain